MKLVDLAPFKPSSKAENIQLQPPYQHSQIHADQQIRLFTFSKTSNSTIISISITDYFLRDKNLPQFNCISYTWNGTCRSSPIYTSSGFLNVTRNLWDALRRLKKKRRYKSLTFWADQICVNQERGSDAEAEKAQQVLLMGKIFRKAESVICWLGEEDEFTQEAYNILNGWARVGEDGKLRDRLAKELTDDVLRRKQTKEGLGPIARLFSRPWWKRIWILQEIYVPRDPVVVCGSFAIGWERLSNAFLNLTETFFGTLAAEALGDDFQYALKMFVLYRSQKSGRIQLSTLLEHSAIRKATDQRDLVYGLLGIAQQQGFQYPKPDYDDNVKSWHVFMRYTRAIIARENSLQVLNYNKKGFSKQVPTWAFYPQDISRDKPVLLLPKQREAYEKQGAAGATEVVLGRPSSSIYSTELELFGIQVGQIRDVIDLKEFIHRIEQPDFRWSMIDKWLGQVARALRSSQNYSWTNESVKTAIVRTLLANDLCVGCPQPRLRYDNEAEKLHHSFYRTGGVSVADSGMETMSGAEQCGYNKDPSWSGKDLLALAQQNFVFGSDTSRKQSKTSKEAAVVRWLEPLIMDMFIRRLESNATDRRLAITRDGQICLVPHVTQRGDAVCVLLGGFYPFILRGGGPGKYNLLGPAFVHGLMDGWAVKAYEDRRQRYPEHDPKEGLTSFCLV